MEKYYPLLKPELKYNYPLIFSKLQAMSGASVGQKTALVQSTFHQGTISLENFYKPCAIVFNEF